MRCWPAVGWDKDGSRDCEFKLGVVWFEDGNGHEVYVAFVDIHVVGVQECVLDVAVFPVDIDACPEPNTACGLIKEMGNLGEDTCLVGE